MKNQLKKLVIFSMTLCPMSVMAAIAPPTLQSIAKPFWAVGLTNADNLLSFNQSDAFAPTVTSTSVSSTYPTVATASVSMNGLLTKLSANVSVNGGNGSNLSFSTPTNNGVAFWSISEADAQALASFSDNLAILGLPNSQGHLLANFYIDGGVNSAYSGWGDSYSSYNTSLSFFGQNSTQHGEAIIGNQSPTILDVIQNSPVTNSVINPQATSIPIDVILNFDSNGYAYGSFSYSVQIATQGFAHYVELRNQSNEVTSIQGGSANAVADFGHTVYWGGISSLTINGQEFANYQVFSADGFDYKISAVPEPETYAMMLTGLGLIGFTTRRRKSLSK